MANTTHTYSGTAGICVQSSVFATSSPNLSLAVDGGSLTASGTGNSDGILLYVGLSQATGATTSLTVTDNAIVRAKNGIKAERVDKPTPSGAGIVFDGGKGTVYGDVTLQENLEIGKDESLAIGDGASLNTGSYEVIVNGGALTGEDKITGTVKYAPAITTEGLPNGTVNEEYSQTLAATGSDTITWSVDSGSLPTGLSLDRSTGTITGTPTTEGTSTFTVKAKNSYGSDSKEYTLTIDPKQTVSVTGVSLSATSLTLTEKETTTLTATVEPADAANQKVTWSSSASAVTTVDANGKVTAVGAGTAVITVTTADGGKTATCKVTVEHDPAGAWSGDADGHWHECAACGDRLDYAGHMRTVENEKKATCTDEGYTGDTVCSVCGYVIAKGETIAATGHSYQDGICTVCGAEEPAKNEETIPATGDVAPLVCALAGISGIALVVAGLRKRASL